MAKRKSSKMTAVENFMNSRLVTITFDSSISDAARTMVENKLSSVIVTKNDNIVGIATERDIVKIAAKDVPLDGITIGSIMSSPLVSISSKATVEELAESMLKNRVRHLLVTDDSENIIGIASATDIARYLRQTLATKQFESLFDVIYPAEYPTAAEREKLFW